MTMRVLLIGAGGHAQVVADILLCAHARGNDATPIGFVDDNLAIQGQSRLGLPILGKLDDVQSISHDAVIIGIGNNRIRAQVFSTLRAQGESLAIAIHPSAIIASCVSIGAGTVIGPGAIVNTGSVVGANVILNTACSVDHHNIIGDHAHVAPGVRLGGDVTICVGALLGIGSVVMPQRSVGEWSIVGAGAVVTKDLASNVTAVGIPAHEVHPK